MAQALIETNPLEGSEFQPGLFLWRSSILSPIEINFDRSQTTLQDTFKDNDMLINYFTSWAVIGGIAQYSVQKQCNAGLLARLSIDFRDATDIEIANDLNEFGEQVMGPEIGTGEDEKYKFNPAFNALGTKFYYVGPPRIVKARFATRAYNGNLPDQDQILDLIQDCNKISIPPARKSSGIETTDQGFIFFHADKGALSHCCFRDAQQYSPQELQKRRFGLVEVMKAERKLLFYPGEIKDRQMDYSGFYYELGD
ncbi:TPA: hypothetical protein ENS27_05785 [bacterium]|nr:hypothetical protein [bacterium]